MIAGDFETSSQFLNNLLNEISFKAFSEAHMEVKLLLATIYTLMNDFELFSQLAHSIQRQIRILGKEKCMHGVYIIKSLKTQFSSGKKNKDQKMREYLKLIKSNFPGHFCPTEVFIKTGYFEKLFLQPS